ncbi:hypothetical protein [Mesobacillus zeae]|uniref:hypothetical protein n=1 Tax=Mesobacillus zeae TaxID=1917180 RepID=UPI003008B40A
MANLDGFNRKFIVLKMSEYDLLSTPTERNHLASVGRKIAKRREDEGKKPVNEYLVINTDESYADEVIDILKRHGHWG